MRTGLTRLAMAALVLAGSVCGFHGASPAQAAAPPGITVTTLRPAEGSAGNALVVLADGSRVIGGRAGGDFALLHLNEGESPGGFGWDGYVTTDFGGRVDVVHGLAGSPAGGVVAAGSSNGDVAVARYGMGGDLDRSFGTEGKVVTDLGSAADAAFGVVSDPAGAVVVAGGTDTSAFVVRYRADGGLDPDFGSGGRVALSWGGSARAIAAQPDGALVVVGSGGASVDVARLDRAGTLDPTFGQGGVTRLPTGAGSSAHALTLLDDGRMLVAGGRAGDLLLARLLPGGQLDPSFGSAGIAVFNHGRNETAHGVALDVDGRIRVVGEATDGTGFASTHLPSGARDLQSPFGGLQVSPPLRAVAIHPRGVFVAGRSRGLMLSTGFTSPNELQTYDFGATKQEARAAVRLADGRIVALGDTSGSIGLVRYTANGALDTSFGMGGRVVSDLAFNPRALAVRPDGRIVVAGIHGPAAALVAFGTDGSVDLTFGEAGRTVTDVGATDWPSPVRWPPASSWPAPPCGGG